MGSLAQNQRTCMKCPHVGWRHGQASGGVVPCTIDGRDIVEHYTTNACPNAYYVDGVPVISFRVNGRKVEGPKRWAALFKRALVWQPGDPVAESVELDYIAHLADRMGCSCSGDWRKILAADPPDFSSAEAYFACAWRWKNKVNVKLGQPVLTLEEARAKWMV